MDRASLKLANQFRSRQYSRNFPLKLANLGLVAGLSRKGNCHDNAVAESFFGSLKNELVCEHDYANRQEARAEIFEYIEVFYNRNRLHQTLGYRTLTAFETRESDA